MICPTCAATIPDNHLACQVCFSRRYFGELWDRQKILVPQIVADKMDLRLAKVGGDTRHILLFGSDRLTYCGEDLNRYSRKYTPWDEGRMVARICPACRLQLTKLINEVNVQTCNTSELSCEPKA